MASVVVSAFGDIINSYRDSNNLPLVGGMLYTASGGVAYPTYVEPTGTIANTNPIILNSRGEIATSSGTSCPLYLQQNVAYTFTLFDAQGNQIWAPPAITPNTTLAGVIAALTQSVIGGVLYPATTYEINANATIANYAYPPGNVLRYGADPTFTTDSTAAITTALSITQADGTCYVRFPPGRYLISTITIYQNGTYQFDDATLVGNASTAQACLVLFTAGYSNVYNMILDCKWNVSNGLGVLANGYACALQWSSASAGSPAQSNNFYGLAIHNCLVGMLFGRLPGDPLALSCPQSENYVYGYHTRGCQNPLYANQAQGFIAFIGGELASSKNEWDINNPGIYNYNAAYVVNLVQGVVRIVGADVEKTDTQLAYGLINSGGLLAIQDCNFEIACQVLALSAGRTVINGMSGGYWSSGSASWCVLTGSPTQNSGQLLITGMVLNKSPGGATANTALVDLGAQTGWDITLTDCRLENQLQLIFYNGSSLPNVWNNGNTLQFQNVESLVSGGATQAPAIPRISSSTYNMLDALGVDNNCTDVTTWYDHDVAGTGALALSTDVPSGTTFFNSVQCTPTSQSYVSTLNLTSLTTVKATAIKVKSGDQFMVSGWYRMTTAGSANVCAIYANSSGAFSTTTDIADNTNLLTNAWSYITGIITVPANVTYMGVGMFGNSATVVRLIGLKVTKLQ